MKFLFIHQNFPGQFLHLAPALAKQGHEVVALTMRQGVNKPTRWKGVLMVPYQAKRTSSKAIHPWLTDMESKVIRGEACYQACKALKAKGFSPDKIIAHPGWGESMFVKDVWPKARLGIYCEFFYKSEGADVNFDPEFPSSNEDSTCRTRLRNLNNFIHFETADAGLSPTKWQASTFPKPFFNRISTIHDGIDTQLIKPNPDAWVRLNDQLKLTPQDEVITFVNRNLEPYRGYHIFMRALPKLLSQRPNARIILVGGDEVSYGSPPASGNWKTIFRDEVWGQLSEQQRQRVHFVGKIPHSTFINLFQVSSVHVYLTYPFVLSWSLLEAMSAGCRIVASDTQPLHEAIQHGKTGLLFDFFDQEAMIEQICQVLDNPKLAEKLGKNARKFAVEHYDLEKMCLPKQIKWVEKL